MEFEPSVEASAAPVSSPRRRYGRQVSAVISLIALTICWGFAVLDGTSVLPRLSLTIALVVVALLALVAEAHGWAIRPIHYQNRLSFVSVITFVWAIFGGLLPALIAGTVYTIGTGASRRLDPLRLAINLAVVTMSAVTCVVVFQGFGQDVVAGPVSGRTEISHIFVATSAAIIAHTIGFMLLGAPVLKSRPTTVSTKIWRFMFVSLLAAPTLTTLVVILLSISTWTLPLLLLHAGAILWAAQIWQQAYENLRAAMSHMSDVLELREPDTRYHSERVADLVKATLDQMPNVDLMATDSITQAARLHDLGKIGVRDSVLLKNGAFTPSERAEMRRHPVVGAEILDAFVLDSLIPAAVRHHHERWDGTGYPSGLTAEDIPIGARVIAVADAYDAMRSSRPYRQGMSHEDAIQELFANAGSQFDPDVVNAFALALSRAENELTGTHQAAR